MTNIRQRKCNLHADLSALYQQLDGASERYESTPSDDNRSAVAALEEELAAKELELEQIKELERTESGVGGGKPPGGKFAPAAELPPEEGEGNLEEHQRQIADWFRQSGFPARDVLNVVQEMGDSSALKSHNLLPFPDNWPTDAELTSEALLDANLLMNARVVLKALYDALENYRGEEVEALYEEAIAVVPICVIRGVGGAHLTGLGKHVAQGDLHGIRRFLAAIKALCLIP